MKLLLTSAGFSTDEIIEHAADLVGKDLGEIKVAAIAEAYAVEAGDHRWVVDELAHANAIFGGDFRLVNLLALGAQAIRAELEAADLIYVLGGHTDYLMSVFNSSGLSAILPELLHTKVYVGSSAGGMVLGRRVSTQAYHEVYGEEGTYGVTNYLELVDFALKPHLFSPLFPKNRPDVLKGVGKTFAGTLYGLPDTAAVMVNGSTTTVLGDALKITNGTVI